MINTTNEECVHSWEQYCSYNDGPHSLDPHTDYRCSRCLIKVVNNPTKKAPLAMRPSSKHSTGPCTCSAPVWGHNDDCPQFKEKPKSTGVPEKLEEAYTTSVMEMKINEIIDYLKAKDNEP